MRTLSQLFALCTVAALAACSVNPVTFPLDDGQRAEDCNAMGDEDGNGLADCSDPVCTNTPSCQPGCGNGRLERGEGCDDGNAITEPCPYGEPSCTVCDATCHDGPGPISFCGDRHVDDPFENCDDGNAITEPCPYREASCTVCDATCHAVPGAVSLCGDGHVDDAFEQCDDSNTDDHDECTNSCALARCGDAIRHIGVEDCDDGNSNNNDECTNVCRAPVCGDGFIHIGVEQCDDGNTTRFDGCDPNCRTEPFEVEPNEDGSISTGAQDIAGNDFATANADANGAFAGSVTIGAALSPAGDEDVFRFTNPSANAVRVQFDTWSSALGLGIPCGTTIDTGLLIHNAAGTVFTANDDRSRDESSTDFCSTVTIDLSAGESVYAHITEFNDDQVLPGYVLQVTYTP